MTTAAALDSLEQSGQIVWQNERYGSRYVIDRDHLVEMLQNHIPVIHAGQPEVITALRDATPQSTWTVVQLWCPRETARSRIIQRHTGDTDARLAAWDATPRLRDADLSIDTSVIAPPESAETIRSIMESSCRPST
jgi:guanylate kinase